MILITEKTIYWYWIALFGAIALLLFSKPANAQPHKKLWVMGYFPGWELGNGTTNSNPPLKIIDFSSMTAVAYFGFVPRSDGTIDSTSNGGNSVGARALATAAHSKGAKVIMSIGGWGSQGGFEGASGPANLKTFVNNIISIVENYGMDGVDLDWEPLTSQDSVSFVNLAKALRDTLDSLGDGKLLTTTCGEGNQGLMAAAQNHVDEINIMTYDMSGAWPGWVTWYNSPIYSDSIKFPPPYNSEYVPSINAEVKAFESAGVDSNKIGIGAEFGGTVWEGASLPNLLPVSVTLSSTGDVPLYASDGSGIMQKYYSPDRYHWDSKAGAGYLSIPSGLLSLLSPAYFISYDDSNSIAAKCDYIKQNHLGGLIIWELGMGYPRPIMNYPLLQAVKASAIDTTTPTDVDTSPGIPTSYSLSQNYPNPFNPSTVISYRVPVASHISLRVYDVLGREVEKLVDGVEGGGEYNVVFDGHKLSSGIYFYRIVAAPDGGTGEFTDEKKMMLLK